jgi:hypothetical protein
VTELYCRSKKSSNLKAFAVRLSGPEVGFSRDSQISSRPNNTETGSIVAGRQRVQNISIRGRGDHGPGFVTELWYRARNLRVIAGWGAGPALVRGRYAQNVRRTYRTKPQSAVMLGFVGVLSLSYALAANSATDLEGRLAFGLIATSLVSIFARSRVKVEGGSIAVTNGLRTRRFETSAVEGFYLKRLFGVPAVAAMRLRTGAEVKAWGILPSKRRDGGRAGEIVRELNVTLASARSPDG